MVGTCQWLRGEGKRYDFANEQVVLVGELLSIWLMYWLQQCWNWLILADIINTHQQQLLLIIKMRSQHQTPRTPKNKIQQQKAHLEELLACQICYCKAALPTLCPHCSKLYCQPCITKSLQLKSQCPNCRQPIRGELTSCSRFMNELSLVLAGLIENEQQLQQCSEHGIGLNYFCEDCERAACCECKMFGEHQSHSFKPMALVYQQKYNQIRDLLSTLRSNIISKEEVINTIQNHLIAIKNNTESQIGQIQEFTQRHRLSLGKSSDKDCHQRQNAEVLGRQAQELRDLQEEVLNKLQKANKNHRYKVDKELADKIQSSIIRSKELLCSNKHSVSPNEATPPFLRHSLNIQSFSKKRINNQPIYSPVIEYQGSAWKMTVCPQGSSKNSKYLSVFVQLLNNPDQINQYDIQIEIVHPSDCRKNIVKQHQAVFEVNQHWGFGKLAKTQQLFSVGMVSEEDSLQVILGVRLSYYFDLYRRREVLLERLQAQSRQSDGRIQQLQQLLYNKSSTSIALVSE